MKMSGAILDRVKAWLRFLSGTWGVVLWPFGLFALCSGRRKFVGVILVALVGVFVLIFFHDINAHLRSRRIWLPFHEWFFGLAVPVEGRDGVFATVPFDGDNATIIVKHIQRGNHSLAVWIPDKMNDFTPVGPDIKLNCKFLDRHGKAIFQIHSDAGFKKSWTWCRGSRGGSKEIYCKYSVPNDVPLDDELQVKIKVTGEVNKFLKLYPNAVFSLDKYSDK